MGDTYFHRIAANKARVVDPEAVQQILDRYECSFHIELKLDEQTGKSFLDIEGEEDWPQAVLQEDLGDQFDPEDPDAWRFLKGAFQIGGKAGFLQLLRDLALLLETPLTVQAFDFATCGDTLYHPVRVCEWHITPGATEIEVNELRHSDDPE